MNSVYKYLTSENAKSFLEDGYIKIGTLYDYREVEKYGEQIGDRHEGTKTEYSHDKEPKKGDELNPLEKKAIKVGPGFTVVNNRVEVKSSSPDYYIYCVSDSYKESILRKLNEDFPDNHYDACVEITSINMLIENINKKLLNGKHIGFGKCHYIGRMHHYTKKAPHPAILKEKKYKYQEEIRIFWNPINPKELEPVILKTDNLKDYCKLMKI